MKFHFTGNLCFFASLLLFLFMPTKNILAQQGTSCNNPLAFNGNSLFYSGTTCGYGDNVAFSGNTIIQIICNGDFIGGEDIIFLFTPSETACYTIEINGDMGASFAMYSACPNDISLFEINTCLGISGVTDLSTTGTTNVVNTQLEEGTPYFLIISSYNGTLGNFPCGDFEINVFMPDAVENDFCSGALPLVGMGSNYEATDCGEPDDWTPEACSATWSSNENGVWYTFNNPTQQDVTLDIYDITCQGGGGTLQMGVWTNNNTCDLSAETNIGCLVTIGDASVTLSNLPVGDYYLFVDGDAGADCTWNFGGTFICDIDRPTPPEPLILCINDALPTTLSVMPNNPANTINWYTSPNITTATPFATATTIPTPETIDNSLVATYTLYITETNVNGSEICESSIASVVVEVIDSPALCNDCGQPNNAIATNITCSSVRLQWDAVPNATAYQIAGRKANGIWKVFAEQTNNYREFTNNVQSNTTYEWSLKTLCPDGWTDWIIPTMDFVTPACKNGEINSYDIFTDAQNLQNEMSLYPNPTQNFVQLAYKINSFDSLQAAETLQLQIIDITGKVVLQKTLAADNTNNLFGLDISQLEKGQYFVSIKTENTQTIDKLIVL